MRRRLCAVTIMTALILTSCGPSVPDLSHVNNDIAAQYVADALLRKDKNYDEGIDYDHSLLQPTPTPMPTPVPVQEADNPGSGNQGTGSSAGTGSNTGGATTDGMQNTSLASVSVTDIYGVNGVTITPTSYQLKNSYGSSAYQIMPQQGNKLAIVYFSISNKSKKAKRVNLAKQNVSAELLVNGNSVGGPLLSFTDNDLQNLNTKIDAGKKKQGVLLFEVAKKTKVSSVEIRFTTDSKEAVSSVK